MRSLLLGAAAAVLLTAPTSAQATYTPQQLRAWQNVADHTWLSACNQRLNAEIIPAGTLGQGVLGQAHVNDTATCTYWIVDGLDNYTGCLITVHEAGHLAGLPHIDGGIMDPYPLSQWPEPTYEPCTRALPPTLTRSDAIQWVQTRWPTIWSLDCRRDTIITRMRCWGTTIHGKRLRWIVWRDGGYLVKGGKLL